MDISNIKFDKEAILEVLKNAGCETSPLEEGHYPFVDSATKVEQESIQYIGLFDWEDDYSKVMGKHLRYKDFFTTINYDNEEKIFYGHIINIDDLVCFDAVNYNEFLKVFKEDCNDYIETCKKYNKEIPWRDYKA